MDLNKYADPPFRYCPLGGCPDPVACGQAMLCGRCDSEDRADARCAGTFHERPMTFNEKDGGQPDVVYYGVELSSRYSQPYEMRVLIAMVNALQDAGLSGVRSISCDSKACAVYSAELHSADSMLADRVGDVMHATAIVEGGGGHNGITVCCDGRWLSEHDPWWCGDI